MKTRNIIMITVLSVLFVTALVLVIVGVVTHTEPGLMGYCPDERRYEVDGADECPELLWDGELPLVVTASTANPNVADPELATSDAVDRINRRLGFQMFTFESGGCGEHASICVFTGVAHEPGFMDSAGSASHHITQGVMRCEAQTSNTGTNELFGMALEHEILHCLGLAHDPCKGAPDPETSIMCAVQRPVPMGVFPPHITDSDRALIRERYNH
jgi:hypothetical protein